MNPETQTDVRSDVQPVATTVGIDLGTTHCALAFSNADDDSSPQTLAIPQVVAAGQTEAKDLLPSFVYIPMNTSLEAPD